MPGVLCGLGERRAAVMTEAQRARYRALALKANVPALLPLIDQAPIEQQNLERADAIARKHIYVIAAIRSRLGLRPSQDEHDALTWVLDLLEETP